MHFGSTLRILRVDSGVSVRELARRIGVSSAYLSRVEHGYDAPPTPDRLIAVADALGLPRAALLELARQTGPAVTGYVRRVPAASSLFLDVARRDLDTAQIARVRAFLDEAFPETTAPPRARLTERLRADRVVRGFVGSTVRDLVEVAVTRLPGARTDSARAIDALLAGEEHTGSALGGGFVAPHAAGSGLADAAVLVVMARPLPIATPDGQAVRIGCVLTSHEPGPDHLEALTRVARLANYELADELCAARSAADVLTIVERIEGLW